MTRDSENYKRVRAVEKALADCSALVEQVYSESAAASWGVTRDEFASALRRSADKHFSVTAASVSRESLARYVSSLHLQDFALACACAQGHTSAWEHFVATYRNYLRAAAAAILRCPAASPAACELADSLFANLYGLTEGQRSEKSLFRYFHGRSSLKTWLRAVLAQRHIDAIRAGRRFSELEDGESQSEQVARDAIVRQRAEMMRDPHREQYVALFTRTLEVTLGLLDPRDRERLRLYYAEQQTLAEIGRRFGEHESSVSRNLDRTRRELRMEVERALRKGPSDGDGLRGLSDAEIALCFEYAAEDAPIDLQTLFAKSETDAVKAERKPS